MIPLDGFVFHASIVVLNALKTNKLLAIRKVPALHWRVGQEKVQNDCPDEGKPSQRQKQQSPPALFDFSSQGAAEVGGIATGSMLANSKTLYEEGAMTIGFRVVSEGRFDEDVVRKFLYDEPASYPGCSGTRTYNECVSDLKAAIAANHKGAQLLEGLVAENSLKVVHFYRYAISHNGCDLARTSGVHVHMTNTRSTDAEVYELRYPVVLRQFSIRGESGGVGRFCGGEDVIRKLEARMPPSVLMLSERRLYRPYGLEGGGSGYWV